MSVRSLTQIFCDRCNPKALNGGVGPKFRGVLTLEVNAFARVDEHDTAGARYRIDWRMLGLAMSLRGWQQHCNEHLCSICLEEEQDAN
jgi:hypothetical protein